jgi:DNA-binding XRE family transcriptional regulator
MGNEIMTGDEFKAWRERMGFTRNDAAEVLAITLTEVCVIEDMLRIPRTYELATNYIEGIGGNMSVQLPPAGAEKRLGH